MGGQKNTGAARTKRPDLRANAKRRQAEKRKAEDAREGVTYASKRRGREEAGLPKHREREQSDEGQKLKPPPPDAAKRVKAIEKKLRHIAELEERRATGASLDDAQLAKIESKEELEGELQLFLNGELR